MFERFIKIKSSLSQDGFTIIELVLVMILIGIISAFVGPRLMEKKTTDARATFDHVRSMIRYAQKLAVAQGRPVYIRLQPSVLPQPATIALCFDAACSAASTQVQAPSGQNSGNGGAACGTGTTWYCEGIPTSVTLTAVNTAGMSYVSSGNATFFFGALGQPFNSTDTPPTSTFSQKLTVTVTGDSTARSFDIERETGYVH